MSHAPGFALVCRLDIDPSAVRRQSRAGLRPSCGRAEAVSERYKEAPVALGLASNGDLLEVFSSDNGSTWTIIVTSPNGTSCLVAAGQDWQPAKPVAKAASRSL